MGVDTNLGILSLLPVVLALVLAFISKDAVFSLTVGCMAGVVIGGHDPATGLSQLFQQAEPRGGPSRFWRPSLCPLP